ncbi:glutathione S-transferase U10-like [Musa acuminata AAA Group]|uniref:glutathione S-transferase U10-like n=1 Tax=Musa acuminata AAA Group TaxID=214697 RepID=UPI0031DA095F
MDSRVGREESDTDMGEAKQVKLYGFWLSPYCTLVHLALKLKGVAYEYVEEDLTNKSATLLQLNPVHQKVPVLVVDGKPVAESRVILEYIDETWAEPSFLPSDPYSRARVRFWVDFFYQRMVPPSYAIIRSQGEELEKATKEFIEVLRILEKGIMEDLPRKKGPFIHGSSPGLLDIIVGAGNPGTKAIEEVADVKLFNEEMTPQLYSYVHAFLSLDLVKNTVVPYDQVLEAIKERRMMALSSSKE